MDDTVWLQEMGWEEVPSRRETAGQLVLIPVGSVEQHGRHLPLGTDSMVAIHVCEEAARKANVLVTPPLWFGWSPHHLALPGTVSVRAEVLLELLFDVLCSLSRHGFDRFIVVNGHRIVNVPWIQICAERAQRELGVRVAIFDPAYMSKEIAGELGFGEVGHAEEIETSHMLHLVPGLVHMERATDYAPPGQRLHYHVDPRSTQDTLCYVPMTARDLERRAPESGGTGGRPTLAAAEKGRRLHEHLVMRLVAVIEEMRLG